RGGLDCARHPTFDVRQCAINVLPYGDATNVKSALVPLAACDPAVCGVCDRTMALKIYSWNVNGIRAAIRKGEFPKFIAEHQPDILCLQETKARQEQVNADVPDYFEYWNSAEKAGYSGTAIFTRWEP